MYFDIYSMKQWNEDHRTNLTRSYENGLADVEAIRILVGKGMSLLGNWFTKWGDSLQTTMPYGQYVHTGNMFIRKPKF
ncbi:MAG: hypothetical protein AAF702_16695 [Chloroflexota bacterium]